VVPAMAGRPCEGLIVSALHQTSSITRWTGLQRPGARTGLAVNELAVTRCAAFSTAFGTGVDMWYYGQYSLLSLGRTIGMNLEVNRRGSPNRFGALMCLRLVPWVHFRQTGW
jgi:hypothetical protein